MDDIAVQQLLAVVVIGGLFSGVIASSRGLSFGAYFIIGVLVPCLGILLAATAKGPGRLAELTPPPGEGWWRDPTGRFEHRYFDGRAWTMHVARAGQPFEDPL